MYVFLTGAPGGGKSIVAPRLAALLGCAWSDLDGVIERRARRPVGRIFEEDGEAAFRALEREALASLSPSYAWHVVAAGGGTVVDGANRARMRELGLIVDLEAAERTLRARLAGGDRPLLRGGAERLHALLAERREAYADADLHVRTDERDPAAVAEAALAAIVAGRGVDVPVGTGYAWHAHAGGLRETGALARRTTGATHAVVVSEPRVERRYGAAVTRALVEAGIETSIVRVASGERAKDARTLSSLWRAFARAGLGRDGLVVALGGGSVGDLAGFAAATYARGIAWIGIPTTVLAQVDASLGGKTAIDLPEGKNLAGAFHDPRAVLADTATLASLPDRDLRSGMAEVVKAGIVADADLVAQLERLAPRIVARDEAALFAAIVSAAAVKADVVAGDPLEAGERMSLNLGHTLGHGIEAASRYRYSHGEAVALGTVFACALAAELGLARPELRERVETLLAAIGLPVRARIPPRAWGFVGRDKKRRAGRLRWVLPRRLGTVSLVEEVPDRALAAAARAVEGRRG